MFLHLLLLIHSSASLTQDQSFVKQEVEGHGYPFEFHEVATADGYLLTLFRIPHGRNSKQSHSPVFLMHGMFNTGYIFLLGPPESSLAYFLADRGYDVWIGNARGTAFSRKHLKMNPDIDAKFWDFSWHEMGMYDLPAIVDFIRKATKRKRFPYIGLSQGCTLFYVLASVKPRYNDYFTVMISLAPVAYMQNSSSPFVSTGPFANLLSRLGFIEIPPKSFRNIFFPILRAICAPGSSLQPLCIRLVYSLLGYDPIEMDIDYISKFFNIPTSVSVREILHHTQNAESGDFRWYDFGIDKNIRLYGREQPPSYNLSKITTPVAMFYSEGDIVAQPKDVDHLCQELGNCVLQYQVSYRNFNHVDFLIAKHIIDLVYDKVLDVIEKYNVR